MTRIVYLVPWLRLKNEESKSINNSSEMTQIRGRLRMLLSSTRDEKFTKEINGNKKGIETNAYGIYQTSVNRKKSYTMG